MITDANNDETEIERILNPTPDSTVDPDSYLCEYCQEPNPKKQKSHHQKTCKKYFKIVEKLEDNSYKCLNCGKICISRSNIHMHISRKLTDASSDEIELILNPNTDSSIVDSGKILNPESDEIPADSDDQIENNSNPNEEKMFTNINADNETEINR